MNYSGIVNYDIANGKGIRVSLFVSGCTNNCKGCFNIEAQSFDYGKPFTLETKMYLIKLLQNKEISGLSLLGGDPMCQSPEDIKTLIELCNYTHSINKDVWLWTGFTVDYLYKHGNEQQKQLMNCVDTIVDGPFIQELKDLRLVFRGSSNQRIIDMIQSKEKNKIILDNQN